MGRLALKLRRCSPVMADCRGSTLIEFAMVLPFLVTLYMGSYVLSDAVACKRKATTTARALSDLTARYTAMTAADTTLVLGAANQTMAPYPTSAGWFRISEVVGVDATHVKVVWSKASNTSALAAGTSLTVASNMAAAGTYLVLGEVAYTYRPGVGNGSIGAISFYDSSFMMPRFSDQVTLQ